MFTSSELLLTTYERSAGDPKPYVPLVSKNCLISVDYTQGFPQYAYMLFKCVLGSLCPVGSPVICLFIFVEIPPTQQTEFL